MTKTSKDQILLDEIKVMDALEKNSKDSVDEIAKSCKFSRQKVWRIIKDLEKRKIIWGYTAITDEEVKNLKHFTVLVNRTNIPVDDTFRNEVVSALIDGKVAGPVKVENIYLTHGISDWIFTFYTPDIISAKKFVEDAFKRYNKYVKGFTLIETLFPIRKQGLKNPQINNLVEYI
jgi:DNA-binding Lrp family transcriptional regulator